jgi:hypothetical protein
MNPASNRPKMNIAFNPSFKERARERIFKEPRIPEEESLYKVSSNR